MLIRDRLIVLEARLDEVLLSRPAYRDYVDGEEIPPGSIASAKLDGIYAKATRDGLFSKTGKRIEGQRKIEKRLKRHFRKNPDSSIEGELTRGRQPLEKTISDYRSGRPLRLHVFPGQGKGPLGVGSIRNIPAKKVNSREDADRHYRRVVKKGHEGQVIQTPSGERIRRKQIDDSEFDVDDIRDGRGGSRVATVSGGGSKSRVLLPAGAAVKRGDRVTVQHQGRQKSGKLRHPRFKAVRDYE